MATIQLKGEDVRQAVKWISDELKEDGGKSITILIQQASRRFNLSPRDEESLRAFYEQE